MRSLKGFVCFGLCPYLALHRGDFKWLIVQGSSQHDRGTKESHQRAQRDGCCESLAHRLGRSSTCSTRQGRHYWEITVRSHHRLCQTLCYHTAASPRHRGKRKANSAVICNREGISLRLDLHRQGYDEKLFIRLTKPKRCGVAGKHFYWIAALEKSFGLDKIVLVLHHKTFMIGNGWAAQQALSLHAWKSQIQIWKTTKRTVIRKQNTVVIKKIKFVNLFYTCGPGTKCTWLNQKWTDRQGRLLPFCLMTYWKQYKRNQRVINFSNLTSSQL